MKNKLLINLLLIIFFYQNILSAEIFSIESPEIKILNKGNVTKATNGVKITSNDGVEISGRELIYNYCNQNHVCNKNCGKLVVGNKNQLSSLESHLYT